VKRKAGDIAENAAAKTIRLSAASESLVSMIAENKKIMESLITEVSSDKSIASMDPDLLSLLSRMCLGMEGNSKIMETLISEIECVKTLVNDLSSCSSATHTSSFEHHSGKHSEAPSLSSRPPATAYTQGRRPLVQTPLGGPPSWTEVVSRKNKQARAAASQPDQDDDYEGSYGEQRQASDLDPFTAAVRDAERSVLLHNLDLGQSPILNPRTISAKVTSAIMTVVNETEGGDSGKISNLAKEVTGDIMSMVKSMDLYGTGTRPCKIPGNPTANGTFYTVPVKLSFQNKQTAQRVTDLLKNRYKLSTSTPYHRSLRTAMNLVREKVKKTHPGNQIIINLEFNARSLEAKIRPEGASSFGNKWSPLPTHFPLPREALDPKISEVSTIRLPPTPNLEISDGSGSEEMDQGSFFTLSNPPKKGKSKDKPRTRSETVSVTKSGTKSGTVITQPHRPGGLARTPPPSPQKGKQP
jgi:hypothetical protein